jgi:perosamine synthetase
MSKKSPAAYVTRVRETFASLKAIRAYDEAVARSLRIGEGFGYLVPVCKLHAEDEYLIGLLTAWRERNQAVFPTRFPTSVDRTRRWLRDRVLDADDRVMFLVLDRHGHLVGHLGFADALNDRFTIKADNMIRGTPWGGRGLMRAAMATEILWAQGVLGARVVQAPILADNGRTIRFFEDLGFRHTRDIPLRRRRVGDHVVLTPVDDGDDAPGDSAWALHELIDAPPSYDPAAPFAGVPAHAGSEGV